MSEYLPMSAVALNDMAYAYSESLSGEIGENYYSNAVEWFREKTKDFTDNNNKEQDYRVFTELVHMWSRNKVELQMADAYMGFPELQ